MYCEKCGAHNKDDSRFCAACGAAISSNRVRKTPVKSGGLLVGLIAVILCIAVFIALAVGLLGGRSAEDTASGLIHALSVLDLVQIHELLPEPVQDSLEGDYPEIYKAQLLERNEEVQSELTSYSSTVKWTQGPMTDVSEDDLNYLKDYYQETYDMKITDAKRLPVTCEITVLGFFSDSFTEEVGLIKYKGGWYLDWESTQNII